MHLVKSTADIVAGKPTINGRLRTELCYLQTGRKDRMLCEDRMLTSTSGHDEALGSVFSSSFNV